MSVRVYKCVARCWYVVYLGPDKILDIWAKLLLQDLFAGVNWGQSISSLYQISHYGDNSLCGTHHPVINIWERTCGQAKVRRQIFSLSDQIITPSYILTFLIIS